LPVGQIWPQPQLSGASRAVQTPLQSASPFLGSQAHAPLLQVSPPVQVVPHAGHDVATRRTIFRPAMGHGRHKVSRAVSFVIPGLLTLLAYVVGSIPSGVLLARSRGVDLRAVGSGNIGASNVGRALGRSFGVLVLILDAAKGYLPVLLAQLLDQGPWAQAVVGFSALLGHSYSLFLRGKGGKSVATALGVAVALAPLAAVGCLAIYVVLVATLRISSIGSIAGVLAFTPLVWLFGPQHPAHYAFGLAAAVLVVVRHIDNLKRLARGEELRAP
jgi:acyl phosphate:glycerol-3-phosphate acyltransferase